MREKKRIVLISIHDFFGYFIFEDSFDRVFVQLEFLLSANIPSGSSITLLN